MRIASFDIGKKNFAFCIEEIDLSDMKAPSSVKSSNYNEDGTPTPIFKEYLDTVYKRGKLILYKNTDLTINCDKKTYLDEETYYNMNDTLEQYTEYWDTCDVFVIEKQMQFGMGKNNPMAQKLGQHCYSYFTFVYGREKKVVEYPAYNKTQVLGAPKVKGKRWKAMDKPARKKWAVIQARELLTLRSDPFLKEFETHKKKDDLADVLLQAISYAILNLS